MPPPLPPGFVLQQPSPSAVAPPPPPAGFVVHSAPAVIHGPAREPPPQTGPQAAHDEHTARTAGLPTGFEWDADGHGAHPIHGTPMDPSYGQNTLDPASITDTERHVAQAMITGRVAPPTGRTLASPQTMRLLAVASQLDPEFDLTTWARRNAASRAFTSGTQGQNITAFNTAIHHIARYALGSDALDNWGSETTPAALSHISNTLRNWMANGNLAGRLTTFNNNADAVASELTRAFRGTNGAEADVQSWRANLRPNMTPQEFHASVQSAINLLRGRIEAMNSSYRQAMGPGATVEDLIDPHSREILHSLENGTLGATGTAAPPPAGTPPPNVPPGGSPGPPTGPQAAEGEPSGLVVDVWPGGPPPRDRAQANATWQNAFQRASMREPGLTWDAFIARNLAPIGQNAAPTTDISAERGANADPNRILTENVIANANPVTGPISQSAQALLGPESANALNRGLTDFPLMGFGNEIHSSINAATGNGTYQGNLARQDAIDDYDYENHFGPRLGGQIIGGLPFAPIGGETLGARVGIGAAEGGAYGFGSGRGGFENRAENALVGAGVGAAAPLALNVAGRGINALRNPGRAELLAAAERQQVPITRLEAGGTPTRMAGGVVGVTPGEIPMVAGTQRSIAGSQAARDRIAGTIGLARDETGAGIAAQRGIRDFRVNAADRRTQLFNRVPIPASTSAPTSGTANALREATSGIESNQPLSEMFRDRRLEGYLAAIEGRQAEVPTGVLDAQGQPITRTVQQGGGLNYGDMRRFRSLVGEMIDQPRVAGEDSSKSALRALYGGLSQDLEATARATSPRALTLMRRAIQYDRGRHARLEGLATDILGRDNTENPLAAYEQINRWARATGGDPNRLGQALRSMPPDEANSVRATIFSRMGQAAAGKQDAAGEVFSPAEFSTQWNKLSERARGFLVPDASHRAALNDLVRITTAQKRSSQYTNFSRTALGAHAIAFFELLHYAPMEAVATAAAAEGTAFSAGMFLGSKAGAGWLRTAARTRNPRLVIQGLSTVAQRDPAIVQQALGLRQYLLSAINDNAPASGRAAASPDGGPNEQQ